MKRDGLTDRELQYAELLAWGGASKEVADRLKVSVRTVENTTKTIYRKIGIQKATELSVWWFVTRLGVPISLDPWKKQIIAFFFLLMILPKEFYGFGDSFRMARTIRTARMARMRRAEDDTINLF